MTGHSTGAQARDDMAAYLAPATYIDSDHPDVADYARRLGGSGEDARQRAVRIYYAVRDDFRYDPYGVELTEFGMKASTVIGRGQGFCITKAALMAACCRLAGIPARLGFADVRNHLASQKLLDLLGTDLFVYHGYTEVYVDGKWVKATPAFNRSLCERFGVKTLEFDGTEDSIFHPFDHDGRRHMEYVRDHGTFDDLPFEDIRASFQATYPGMYGDAAAGTLNGDMEREFEAESTRD